MCGPRAEWSRCGGQAIQRPWQNFARISLLFVSSFLVDCEKRWKIVGLSNGPLEPEGFPHKSRLLEFPVAPMLPGLSGL
jgi:hypothetical protein